MPVLRVALPTPLRRLFDYLPPQPLDHKALIPGIRVEVPFQSRKLVGILIEVAQESTIPVEKLREALALLDDKPILPDDIFELCLWAADYYHCSLGEVLSSALPALLRKGKPAEIKTKKLKASLLETSTLSLPQLNEAQQQAVNAISHAKNSFKTFLLDGVTGSGKTEVYLRSIETILENGQQVLVLVPEISLTPQTIERFRERFRVPIVAWHSNLSERERLNAWLQARGGEAKIIIGTRSAIFTPFADLGLIIVDEEHDVSFKQQDRFRYHARDLAVMRAHHHQIPIVLGSATPSLESLLNVKRKRYDYLSLPERAGKASLPQYQLIDLRSETPEEGLSPSLLNAMRLHLAKDNQVMLFLNRRGFAPVLYCTQCAFISECRRCDARMVYHANPKRLHCHYCDLRADVPTHCAACGGATLEPIGLGTQRLEQTLEKHFPAIPIIRVDRDSTRRKDAMQDLLDQIHHQKKAILLGTQMLAKGHHFKDVTLVGIVDADSGLFSADFRAAEQMGQLLLQVSGRAGRAEKPGTVFIQTRNPDHMLWQILLQQGYSHFADKLLLEREQAVLPPYSYFAMFRVEAYSEKNANQFLTMIKGMCAPTDKISLMGPFPAMIAKRKGLYCQHLLVKADKRGLLQHFLKNLLQQIDKLPERLQVKWVLDVDPVEV